jgi:hypothetical protein
MRKTSENNRRTGRDERLAAALKANIRRRKDQARERAKQELQASSTDNRKTVSGKDAP